MAALVLSVAGGAAGALFGPAGAIAGRIAGALVGNVIDRKLFGPGNQNVVGPRLADLDVTEGRARSIRRWCHDTKLHAEKRDGEWWVDPTDPRVRS